GADASSAGMVDAGFENQKELTKMQLDNQKEIAEMQNETQKEIAGIQSATSRQNTKRSEERRVGKECRSRWTTNDKKKINTNAQLPDSRLMQQSTRFSAKRRAAR